MFCHNSGVQRVALQARAFDHSATCPKPQIAQIDAGLRRLAEGRLAGEGGRLKGGQGLYRLAQISGICAICDLL